MCKVYAIASQKGGVGKTTTAANFGIELAREGYKVILMDKMEERKQEKEASVEKNDKSQDDRGDKKAEAKTAIKEEKGLKSLKDRISNKQEEVAKKEATREPAAQKSKKMAIG